ncbi:metabolite traffic protein EboE [Catenovulum adriaticum]|uniref:Metabolite traffic protein EboE n=1 Tax=Catenovulum adriaticum TaxID=2984846 RepID=A0ABY7AQ02_9ALTE|nr:metabolite traffic protein EboE [Catenovulum sp. TS8]WAJ71357.1 metabolite traffic protein EboE [Catenovulum sp. TS8]
MLPINLWQSQELAYCSNVHPGTELTQVLANIQNWFNPVLKKRQQNSMASGLWLASPVAKQLVNDNDALQNFVNVITQNQLALTSLNGFPYGNFHQDIVKQAVYLPTWADKKRLVYTQNLANILSQTICKKTATQIQLQGETRYLGAISTLPLAYAKEWTSQLHQIAIEHLIELAQYLKQLEQNTQVRIQIGLEMEPDCVFESSQQLIDFFKQDLLPAAKNKGLAAQDILNYIGCCFDTCHQAVMHEDIQLSLKKIREAGIQICKIQISNAIHATLKNKHNIEALCQLLNDKKFLHQCKINQSNVNNKTNLIHIADLNSAELNQVLAQKQLQGEPEFSCTVHYHVPIHLSQIKLSEAQKINTTQTGILACLDYLQSQADFKPYLEIETYTWLQYLTSQAQDSFDLTQGLSEEFFWLEAQLNKRNLLANKIT